jgi:hypothetical protein
MENKQKFTIEHDGVVISFNSFHNNDRSEKIIAKEVMQFLRNHVSASQYLSIVWELSGDLALPEMKTWRNEQRKK